MSRKFNMLLDLDDLSIDPLRILWYCRLHPALNPITTTILSITNIIICFLFIGLAVEGVRVSYKSDLFFMAECLQTCTLMIHIVFILLTITLKRSNLYKLIDDKTQFWKLYDFEESSYEDCLIVSKIVKKILRFYCGLICGVLIVFDMQPITSGNLPTVCYVPPGWYNYLAAILLYLSIVTAMTVAGTDSFFCSLATSLIIQFKLLNNKFKSRQFNTSNAKSWQELKLLIKYHNFLLRYCVDLNKTFQGIFLIKFLTSIASGAISVFIFMQPGLWSNRIKFVIYFVATTIESAFYCVPLEYVTSLASTVGNSFYESNWYRIQDNQLKQSLVLVTVRSQKSVLFSAYGLVWINLSTFVTVCKTVFSFYTYLSTVQN